MANGTAAVTSATRGTGREPVSAPVTPVDEKRFESEIRRTDAAVSEERRNREKFETRIEKAVHDLRGEMNTGFKDLRDEMHGEMKDLRGDMKDLRGDIGANFRWLIGTYISVMVAILAAFYAFASYIKKG
jgi:hypothetical protein